MLLPEYLRGLTDEILEIIWKIPRNPRLVIVSGIGVAAGTLFKFYRWIVTVVTIVGVTIHIMYGYAV